MKHGLFWDEWFWFKTPPHWPSGYGVRLERRRSQVRIPLAPGFFRGRVIPVTLKLARQWLPCQAPGGIGSVLGLVGPVSVWSATSISVWQHVKLSEHIRPWNTLACYWDVKQPTNKQFWFMSSTLHEFYSFRMCLKSLQWSWWSQWCMWAAVCVCCVCCWSSSLTPPASSQSFELFFMCDIYSICVLEVRFLY